VEKVLLASKLEQRVLQRGVAELFKHLG
jgi:hypothetical protein